MIQTKDLKFNYIDDKTKIKITIYNHFIYDMFIEETENILGPFELKNNKIEMKKFSGQRAEKRLTRLISSIKKDLKFSITANKAIFIDQELELSLIGLNFIGIIDKGSEMIEIKPITGCNIDCTFCSVNEGKSSKKEVDFVIDKDYLIEELTKLLEYKEHDKMSIWINPHGEPLLYSNIIELIDGILADKHVNDVNIVTNGLLMTKDKTDKLCEIENKYEKRISISFSISSICNGCNVMGENYNHKKVIENLNYVAKKLDIKITPVYLKGKNDEEIENIIDLAKELNKNTKKHITVSIQKFCRNKMGRNPIKEQDWDEFFAWLKDMENKKDYKLTTELGKIAKTKELPQICKKGDKVEAKIICDSRYKKDKIGRIYSKDGSRACLILGAKLEKGRIKGTVIQSKHNNIILKS